MELFVLDTNTSNYLTVFKQKIPMLENIQLCANKWAQGCFEIMLPTKTLCTNHDEPDMQDTAGEARTSS